MDQPEQVHNPSYILHFPILILTFSIACRMLSPGIDFRLRHAACENVPTNGHEGHASICPS